MFIEVAAAPAPEFHLDTRMGMPLNLMTSSAQPQDDYNDYENEGDYYNDCNGYYDDEQQNGVDVNEDDAVVNNGEVKTSVLTQELLSEKPANWNE